MPVGLNKYVKFSCRTNRRVCASAAPNRQSLSPRLTALIPPPAPHSRVGRLPRRLLAEARRYQALRAVATMDDHGKLRFTETLVLFRRAARPLLPMPRTSDPLATFNAYSL